jgi:hypothetical protein
MAAGWQNKKTLRGAHRIVSVQVTEPLIDRAEQKDSGHCMIADSIRVALPEAKSVSVDLATIRFTDPKKGQRYIYLTPPSTQRALIQFDQGIHTEPFTFRLVKAAQVVEAGRRRSSDGSTARPSEAVQGVVGGSGRKQPIKLGGKLPARGAVSSMPSRAKTAAAAQAGPKTTKGVTPKATRMPKEARRAADLQAAKKAAAGRDPSAPALNITMANESKGRVREFGLKQLRK